MSGMRWKTSVQAMPKAILFLLFLGYGPLMHGEASASGDDADSSSLSSNNEGSTTFAAALSTEPIGENPSKSGSNKTAEMIALLEEISELRDSRRIDSDEEEWAEKLSKLVDKAESLDNTKTAELKGELYLLGEGFPRNLTLALKFLKEAAAKGNPRAQMHLGFMYGKGFHKNGLADKDEAQSLLNYYFAALGGVAEAQMVLGFRHLYGYGVPKSCTASMKYYSKVADAVVEYHSKKAISKPIELVRLSDDKARNNKLEETEDVIQYYQHSADNGNADAQVALGQLNFYGARGVQQNTEAAARYFRQAAEQGNAAAKANLAQMHMQGLGVEQNNKTAFKYFHEAAAKGDAAAQNGLGYMYLHGYGTTKDQKKAIKFFKMSAEQGNVDAQFNLGVMYFGGMGIDVDYGAALQYFTLAGHQGHIRSLFNLAQMHMNGLGTVQSCPIAVKLFKSVSERGYWAKWLTSAHKDYIREDYDSALIKYCRASDQGYEMAQSNAAWLLGKDHVVYHPFEDRHLASLHHLEKAALQGNVDAHRMIGDYYYYGLSGGGNNNNTPDYEQAARHYTLAGEQKNAHANFNLGFMHQHGVGLPFDLHLAKRFYDLALESSPDAYVPVQLALLGLQLHQFYLDFVKWWQDPSSPFGSGSNSDKKTTKEASENDDEGAANAGGEKQAESGQNTAQRAKGNKRSSSGKGSKTTWEDLILLFACGFLAILIFFRSRRVT
mmetsp:Transcript_23138/g.37160  ORF Transcript_23138/g.37160 Transcript_23138/m.37160 type:complete len:721 (+) Transcript_23138:198-2360(+)